MKKLIVLLAIVALALAGNVWAGEQGKTPKTGNLTVTVTDPKGNVIPNEKVEPAQTPDRLKLDNTELRAANDKLTKDNKALKDSLTKMRAMLQKTFAMLQQARQDADQKEIEAAAKEMGGKKGK